MSDSSMESKTTSISADFVSSVGEICTDLVTTMQGLMVTAKYLTKPSEIVTERYPLVKKPIPGNYRGRLLNETDRCIVCELCAKACPTQCIDMKFEIGADKKRILHNFRIDMTICLYCGLCTEACPDTTRDAAGEKCLTMSGGYEYSSHRKEEIGFYYYAAEAEIEALRAAAKERADKAAAEKASAAAAKAATAAAAAKTKAESAPAIEAKVETKPAAAVKPAPKGDAA